MKEENPFPCRSHRLSLKPPLTPEVTCGRQSHHHSTETSTISTSGEASSSHILELAQVVSTNLGLSTVVKIESSQLPVVTIHPICETIPPETDVVQLEVDLDPIVL